MWHRTFTAGLLVLASGCAVSPPEAQVAVRPLQDIQEGFAAGKGRIAAVFKAYQQSHPDMLPGKVVVRITIAPDGSVTEAQSILSTYQDSELVNAVVAETMQLSFTPREVPSFTYPNYPINYIPKWNAPNK